MVTRNQSNAEFRSEVHDILGRHKNSLDQIHATLQTILSELQSLRASHAIASKTNPFAPATSSHQVPQPATSNNTPLTGVVFAPFEEVKKELDLVPNVPQVSLARPKYSDESEATINEQINVEYNVSYVYHAMFAYFDRDNVGPKESSLQEREHAKKLMEYQNKRGGKVKLQSIVMPLNEFDHVEKGDALYAMKLALSLEKLTNEKLFNLHQVANRNKYVKLADFIEIEFLTEQDEDSFYPCGQG